MNKQLLLIMSLHCMTVDAKIASPKMLLQSQVIKTIQTSVKNHLSPDNMIIKKQANLLVVTRKNQRPSWRQADREKVHKILTNFATVMQCFFNIVQEPENKQKVALNIANMFLNFLNAGKVIVGKTDILMDADKQRVKELLSVIDTPPTREICTVITRNNM